MILALKGYQRTCLEKLTEYLRAACKQGAAAAFMEAAGVPYRGVDQLPGLPYVCLRVPTGGGKTLLAAHAVGIATKEFLEIENSVVLWLAPSGAIVSQTLDALRNRQHPYRRALDDVFASVEVFDVKEALYVQRGVLDSSTVVIIATLQSLRVEQTEGRKVYESAGPCTITSRLCPKNSWPSFATTMA